MNLKTVLYGIAIVAVVVLFFFGIIFAVASAYEPTRLTVAAWLFGAGFGIAIISLISHLLTRKPTTITQRLELSGPMKAVELKCPNCSAAVDAKEIKIVSGVPYATCPYCGQTFEVAEEPKW